MSLLDRILNFGSAGSAGYVVISIALLAMAALAMWKGRKIGIGAGFVPLFHAVMVFAAARVSFLAYTPGSPDEDFVRVLTFSLLSAISFYFLALSTARFVGTPAAAGDGAGEADKTEPILSKALVREMLLLGIAVACMFIATPVVKTTHVLVFGFINALLVGATARLGAFALRRAS